jgi:hypothetical protein
MNRIDQNVLESTTRHSIHNITLLSFTVIILGKDFPSYFLSFFHGLDILSQPGWIDFLLCDHKHRSLLRQTNNHQFMKISLAIHSIRHCLLRHDNGIVSR